jgi:Na+/melibiose symporter-like transporter
LTGKVKDLPVAAAQSRFDFAGVILSATAMGFVVLALVSASTWGFVVPLDPPFEVLGFSPTIPMVLVGLLIGWGFLTWERHLVAAGRQPLVGPDLFGLATLRAGLASQMILYFIIAGTFFILPLYLQTVLGLDALDSGIRMLPLSVALFVMAIVGSRLATRFSPRTLIRAGILVACAGLLLLTAAITPEARGLLFASAMAIIGLGVGLAISQIGNVNLSAADDSRSNELGGLQGAAQNLGSSFGVALAGTAVFIGLAATFTTGLAENPSINAALQEGIIEASAGGVPVITVDQAGEVLEAEGVPADQIDVVLDEYAESKLQALRAGLGIVFIIGLVGLPLTRGLPREVLAD